MQKKSKDPYIACKSNKYMDWYESPIAIQKN